MIKPVTMYEASCDNCGIPWHDSSTGFIALNSYAGLRAYLIDCEWHISDDDKTYCGNCWSYDDNDKIVIKGLKSS